MREMKNSGIEWIGDIPSNWQVAKLKHSIKWKSEKLLSYADGIYTGY